MTRCGGCHVATGESQEDIRPRMAALAESGIGGILDYAAEDDVDTEDGPASRSEPHDTVVARTFDYNTEAKCDAHTATFLQSIAAAAEADGQGFAAVKVGFSLPHNAIESFGQEVQQIFALKFQINLGLVSSCGVFS